MYTIIISEEEIGFELNFISVKIVVKWSKDLMNWIVKRRFQRKKKGTLLAMKPLKYFQKNVSDYIQGGDHCIGKIAL